MRDAENIENVSHIIASHSSDSQSLIVVVSALGKTTNHLERIVKSYQSHSSDVQSEIDSLFDHHIEIIEKLNFESQDLLKEIGIIKRTLEAFMTANESDNYNYIYDQIVSKGEILSTTILHHYLKSKNVNSSLINARNLIKTDSNYTDANIDWTSTQAAVNEVMASNTASIVITQGFIGANSEMLYTTLGREGSDYTAAILASCTHTHEMTIWKDVDGVYTADPKKFPDAKIIEKLSYKEAIEMTFYGAQVIHPKTIKPIQNTNCILKVRSFLDMNAHGTSIGNFESQNYLPSVVLKENQVLYCFASRDFSFLNESNLGKIISTFGKYSLRINLMQNTAIEFMVVTDEKLGKNELIVEDLSSDWDIMITNHLKLMTIRHYTEEMLQRQRENKDVLLTQKGEATIQYLMR